MQIKNTTNETVFFSFEENGKIEIVSGKNIPTSNTVILEKNQMFDFDTREVS